MLNGLKTLFTSGLILQPMVLTGILVGYLLSSFLGMEEGFAIFADYNTYLMAAAWAGLYTVFFNHVYRGRTQLLDYKAMGGKFVSNVFRFVLSAFLSLVFFSTLFF